MGSGLITAFTKFPDPLVNLSKPRLETLAMPTLGMIAARTVNLSHIAPERGISGVQIASTYRRLQRFFQHVRLPQDAAPGLGGAGGCGDGRPAGQAGSGAGPDQLENIVKDVPFTVRLREKMYAALDGERKTWLSTLLITPRKGRSAVATLNGLVAIADASATKAAQTALGKRKPPKKNHKYFAKSCFRIGLDFIRNRMKADPDNALDEWKNLETQPEFKGVV